jgi:3-dehydroquinate dehydratase/shikimate dehydrogenase
LNALPFFVVTLTHATWEEAVRCVEGLPSEAIPELRLDLFPDYEAPALVHSLARRCLVSCRRSEEGGRWEGTETERLARLLSALEARPVWLDLEWDIAPSEAIRQHGPHTRLLRSVHVPEGVFDLEARMDQLPEGDAYKWVGVASRLSENARLKPALARARNHGIQLSAFLMGPKGLPSRCLQRAWGGAFTFAAPDDGPPAAPGQLPFSTLWNWRLHRLNPNFALCGVLGEPVLHSRGPAYHNARFQRNFKDLLYLPLQTGDAQEACEAMEELGILGASLTAPLKATLPARLHLPGPLNTLWRRTPSEPWEGANTDAEALGQFVSSRPKGVVLILGDGGVAATSRVTLEGQGFTCIQASRRHPMTPGAIVSSAPVGVVQATSLGMDAADPAPFPELLEAALPSLRWAAEWIYKSDTAFAQWARIQELPLIEGAELFEAQAEAQARRFIEGCG